jgi:hypothetical protein
VPALHVCLFTETGRGLDHGPQLEQFLPQLAKVIELSPQGRQCMSPNHGVHFSGGEPFLLEGI